MTGDAPVQLDDDQVAWLRGLKMSKRAAVVRDHILNYGSVTTGELGTLYGYKHPPRAARDLIDAGAGVAKRMVTVDGARMAQYYFTGAANKNAAGRVVIPKAFADRVKADAGHQCGVCSGVFANRELQCDHRVPFAIGGDKPSMEVGDFIPLCASDNRAKSWSCEHCSNWAKRDVSMCETCFWAHPEDYAHVAGRLERRVTVVLQGDDAKKVTGSSEDLSRKVREFLLE